MDKPKLYCSLDIETTGFDPTSEEILEVGFLFFEAGPKGIKLLEEWTQVFQPAKKPSPKILGLTGITQSELDAAPKFAEFRDFLQEKLGRAVIVGHNIAFDTKFLESFGIKFSGQTLDTMDLVQWLLPTHHSYNLENLMHYFKIPHTEAHRALADAKAALKVLERLLDEYAGLPEEVKAQIQQIISPFGFSWQPLLAAARSSKRKGGPQKTAAASHKPGKPDSQAAFEDYALKPGQLNDFPLFSDYAASLAGKLAKARKKSILVLPKKQQVMDIWKSGLAKGVFPPEESFDAEKFEQALKKPARSPEEARYLIKVLVWRSINWQQQYLCDLNLTFFGGQFKSLAARADYGLDEKAKLWVCDVPTFIDLAKSTSALKDRFAVVCGLSELESGLSQGISHRVSWGYVNYLLKSYYNPETETGSEAHKQQVETALNEADLFFGLASGLLKQNSEGFEYYRVSQPGQESPALARVRQAALNYAEKLADTAKKLESEALGTTARNLQAFFENRENRVRWLELSEGRCIFYDNPIDLSGSMREISDGCSGVCFADSLGMPSIISLFGSRLGLAKLKVEKIKHAANPGERLQGDLFSGFWAKKGVSCMLKPAALTGEELANYAKSGNLPGAVLFGNPLQVREFYEQYYEKIQVYANILSQNHSGGSNKLFRNFEIYSKSLLLATDKLVLKYLNDFSGVYASAGLSVKTLVLNHLPFEQYTHPYLEAVAKTFEKPFEQFSLPRAVYNFYKILGFFHSPLLKQVIVADPKLAKDYASVFKEFLAQVPEFKLEVG